MVSKAQKAKDRAEKVAFLKSALGHAIGIGIAFYGFWQSNPALGWGGAVAGVLVPLLRNYLDKKYPGYGK